MKLTTEENKTIVRGYMEEVINKENMEAFDDYFFLEVSFNGSLITKENFVGMLRFMRSAFPDLRLTIEDQIAEGDKVATYVTFQGTHLGEFNGIPQTGKKISYKGVALDRIEDGKIVEMWHVSDDLNILRQLGVTP